MTKKSLTIITKIIEKCSKMYLLPDWTPVYADCKPWVKYEEDPLKYVSRSSCGWVRAEPGSVYLEINKRYLYKNIKEI